jgi:hypothetical protein
MALPTKRDLVQRIGMSVDYWDDQCSKQRIPFTKIGNRIFFTEQQIARIVEMHAVEPKTVPTRDEVGRKRAARIGRAA